jgi:hypothetical protein
MAYLYLTQLLKKVDQKFLYLAPLNFYKKLIKNFYIFLYLAPLNFYKKLIKNFYIFLYLAPPFLKVEKGGF